jgi:ADP-heptose:LPS heptosyltransferase
VIANDAIGNFVMATPLLQMLRSELDPSELHLYCGSRVAEFERESDLADRFFDLHGLEPEGFLQLMADRRGQYDLVVNVEATGLSKTAAWLLSEDGYVCGPCLGDGGRGDLDFADDDRGKLWTDKEWVSGDLTLRYPFLRSGFISEIFARLCYLEGPLASYKVPSATPKGKTPDVLISTAASLPEKLWPVSKWIEACNRLTERGFKVGLLGARPGDQGRYWKGEDAEFELIRSTDVMDLRGAFSLPEVVGALAAARFVLTLDNGILHLAVAAGTPTIGLYRHGIHRLWAPPFEHLTVITPGEGNPMSVISVERVLEAVDRVLA